MRKNKVTYDKYDKASRIVYNNFLMGHNMDTKEIKDAKIICDLYKKQNRLNPFSFLEHEYNNHIKYGKVCKSLKKLILSSMFLLPLLFIGYWYKPFALVFGVLLMLMLVVPTLLGTLYYDDRYEIEKLKYKKAKSDPNWEREQKLKKILK